MYYLDHQKEVNSIAHCVGWKNHMAALILITSFPISKNFQHLYSFVKKLLSVPNTLSMGCKRFHISRFRLDYLKANFYTWEFLFLRKVFLYQTSLHSAQQLYKNYICCLDLQPTWFKTLRQALQSVPGLKCLPKPLNIRKFIFTNLSFWKSKHFIYTPVTTQQGTGDNLSISYLCSDNEVMV